MKKLIFCRDRFRSARRWIHSRITELCWLLDIPRFIVLAVVLFVAICHSATAQIGNSYSAHLDNKFAPENPSAPDENTLTPEQIKTVDFERAIKAQAQRMSLPPPPPAAPLPTASVMSSAIAVPISAALFIGLAALMLKRKVDLAILATETARGNLNFLESDPSLQGFFVELRDALGTHVNIGKASSEKSVSVAPLELEPFLESLPGRFTNLRALVSEVARASGFADQKQPLASLYEQITVLRNNFQAPTLQPASLMACAVEGLLKQILNATSEFNASIQRSLIAAIDLLEALSSNGINPSLATDPPIRMLAVDDDPISRCAISFALKKVFEAPTLASGGEEALAFVTRQPYDIIFLDVEMPGMDGFELCTKIRETPTNQKTPVVFVTRHSDFKAREKSNLSGGQDLIGKPYVSFEITVKALTMILRNRLQNGALVSSTIKPTAPALPTIDQSKSAEKTAQAQKPDLEKLYSASIPLTYSTTTGSSDSDSELEPRESTASFRNRANEHVDPFPDWAPGYLDNLRNQLQTAACCSVEEHLRELLTGAYLAIHSFGVEAERAKLRNIHQISSVLEKMLKRLMESPNLCTPSTFEAASAALELLAELSSRDADGPDFADPLPRILVVDDDPLARRGVSGAIQLVFGKPDTAESGEDAIAIAAEKPFDLIFLDVVMPGLDGFAACKKIHQTVPNRQTPIVFVTSHDDARSRTQAAAAGGCGFIPKPVLSSQLTLIALTFIVRNRLEKVDFTPTSDPSTGSDTELISAV